MDNFTIKDLETLSGIRAHTLRIWEQRYDFLKPSRTNTNIRYYSNEELKSVLDIAFLNKYGYRISTIAGLSKKERKEKLAAVTEPAAQDEKIVNELVHAMIDLDMQQLESILVNSIQSYGAEAAILQIIYPFVERTGILERWGNLHPARGHLVTNIIRQKLIVAIETTDSSQRIERSFLLFLPQGEQDELGLLFYYFLLVNRGAKTIYLGSNVPIPDVSYVIDKKKPDYTMAYFSSNNQVISTEKLITEMHKRFKNTKVLFAGTSAREFKRKANAGVLFVETPQELLSFLKSL